MKLRANLFYPWSGLALSWNDTFGTNPVSLATEYSTVIKRPSGSHTEYFPVTYLCDIKWKKKKYEKKEIKTKTKTKWKKLAQLSQKSNTQNNSNIKSNPQSQTNHFSKNYFNSFTKYFYLAFGITNLVFIEKKHFFGIFHFILIFILQKEKNKGTSKHRMNLIY